MTNDGLVILGLLAYYFILLIVLTIANGAIQMREGWGTMKESIRKLQAREFPEISPREKRLTRLYVIVVWFIYAFTFLGVFGSLFFQDSVFSSISIWIYIFPFFLLIIAGFLYQFFKSEEISDERSGTEQELPTWFLIWLQPRVFIQRIENLPVFRQRSIALGLYILTIIILLQSNGSVTVGDDGASNSIFVSLGLYFIIAFLWMLMEIALSVRLIYYTARMLGANVPFEMSQLALIWYKAVYSIHRLVLIGVGLGLFGETWNRYRYPYVSISGIFTATEDIIVFPEMELLSYVFVATIVIFFLWRQWLYLEMSRELFSLSVWKTLVVVASPIIFFFVFVISPALIALALT